MPDGKVAPEYRGWVSKWTNYLKGWQKRWFVLNNGLLSYYRTQEEMAHTCRGTINLAGALIDTVDTLNFNISNGGTQQWYLRAPSDIERQRWVTALELAKAKALKQLELEHHNSGVSWIDPSDKTLDSTATLHNLNAKYDTLKTCSSLIQRHGGELQREVSTLSSEQAASESSVAQYKCALEKATLVKVSTTALMSACNDLMSAAQIHQQTVTEELHSEREKRQRLEETVEAIAKQHNALECAVKKNVVSRTSSTASDGHDEVEGAVSGSDSSGTAGRNHGAAMGSSPTHTGYDDEDSDDGEFYDAEEGPARSPVPLASAVDKMSVDRVGSGASTTSGESTSVCITAEERQLALQPMGWPSLPPIDPKRARQYRSTIPPKPSHRMSLWGIMKNCIGRDLAKIPMPVNFNEPLSFLQRLCEVELEYSALLDRAAACPDPLEQLALVAAFTVSTYSSTAYRVGKPFNPMLGETYEFDRTADLGWRCLCEQVSHHPPASAMHVESANWKYWQDYTMSSKFRGKYLQILPQGIAHLAFRESGNHYTCNKVTTTIHNIIVGKLWMDQSGETKIVNHKTGDYCHLKYSAYSYFSKEQPHKVTGIIYDSNKVARYHLSGTWDNRIEYRKVMSDAAPGGPGVVAKTPNPHLAPAQLAWEKSPLEAGYDKRYGFCSMACALNDSSEAGVAPTDARFRPDQRLMEKGDFDEANVVKVRLEDAQRARRRQLEARIAELESGGRADAAHEARYRPKWFEPVDDPLSGRVLHRYQGGYWEAKAANSWPRNLLDLWSLPGKKE